MSSLANEAPVPPQRIFEFAHERPRILRAVQEAPAFDLGSINVPALICASWSDHGLHSRGSFEAFKQISSDQKWLFTHGCSKWDTCYSEEALQVQLQFLDHFLKGADNGMDDVPSVRLEVREDIDTDQVRHEDTWPLTGTDYTSLFLDSVNGALLESRSCPAAHCSEPGESLRLVVQGEDLINHRALAHTSSVNRGTHTIHSGGQYDSQLLVPVIP